VNCGDSNIVREFWEKLEKLVEKLGASLHELPCVQPFGLALESQTGNFV
jgi:hypothetical protein